MKFVVMVLERTFLEADIPTFIDASGGRGHQGYDADDKSQNEVCGLFPWANQGYEVGRKYYRDRIHPSV